MADKSRSVFQADKNFVTEQTKRLAADLAFYARGSVQIKLVEGAHIAYTYNTQDKDHAIPIVMNPNCLNKVRHRERAIAIWRGIGFHELAHHLWPAEEQYKIAYAEGFKSLFNLIDDEQNERLGRSKDPAWGACFQTVCAYIFPTKKAKKISTGIVDSEKEEEPEGLEAHEIYSQRWSEFAYHFRRHLPGAADTLVIEALGLIPKNFMTLNKESLLELTRQVHQVLCRGIEMPQVATNATNKPAKEEEAEPEEPDAEEPKQADAKQNAWFNFNVKALFRSKWSYVTLAVCILAWSALFLSTGTLIWAQVFWTGVAIAGIVILVIIGRAILRRLWPKKLTLNSVLEEKDGLIMQGVSAGLGFASWLFQGIAGFTSKCFSWLPLDGVKRFFRRVWQKCKQKARAIKRRLNVFALWLGKHGQRLWRQTWFRIAILSIPIALTLVVLYSVGYETKEASWWALVGLLAWIIALALLTWFFRKKILAFLMAEFVNDKVLAYDFGCDFPQDKDTLSFTVINSIKPIDADQSFINEMMPLVHPLAQQLRTQLEKCGTVNVELDGQDEGYDLVEELEQLDMGQTSIFVNDGLKPNASLHLEMALDCSSSMNSSTASLKQGEKHRLGKFFALVVEEATKDLTHISSHFWGFNDTMIYDCGEAGQGRISGLPCGGGNNDTAMLWQMGQSAAASGKQMKILLMISDGQPSDCSWGSLNHLVAQLEGEGMIPVQIAVDKIADPAFKRYFVDLVGQTMAEAVITMGEMLLSLVEEGT